MRVIVGWALLLLQRTVQAPRQGTYSQQGPKGRRNPVEPMVMPEPGDQGRAKASCWIEAPNSGNDHSVCEIAQAAFTRPM